MCGGQEGGGVDLGLGRGLVVLLLLLVIAVVGRLLLLLLLLAVGGRVDVVVVGHRWVELGGA